MTKESVFSDVEKPTLPLSILHFPEGLIGFEILKSFSLTFIGEDFWELCSQDNPAIRFIVIPLPFSNLAIKEEDLEPFLKSLSIEDQDHQVFAIIAIERQEKSTISINLRAPLILDKKTSRAWQIILSNSNYPVSMPLIQY